MNRTVVNIFLGYLTALCLLSLSGCETAPRTPQARTFATLQASAAGIDVYRANFESAYAAGKITREERNECARRFNKVNDAIIQAAEALAAGMSATTPDDVDRFVREFTEFVTSVIPPPQ